MMRLDRLPRPTAATLSPPQSASRLVERISTPDSENRTRAAKLGGLVLTRHLGESIMVGTEVEVEVVGLKSGSARLKIVAPRSIGVHRREVYDEIQVNPQPNRFAPVADEANPAVRPSNSKGGLVLTRGVHQSIMIGDDVELAIVEVRPGTVKIKIIAPKTVSVHRREVFEAIHGHQD